MKIVVIGGTGLIGSKTVPILRQGDHEVVAASPKGGVNTITGEGLKEALAGAQVVIDLANSPSFEDKMHKPSGLVISARSVAGLWQKSLNQCLFNTSDVSAAMQRTSLTHGDRHVQRRIQRTGTASLSGQASWRHGCHCAIGNGPG